MICVSPGERVLWLHEMRGGYGYVERVPARVKRLGSSRVLIEAERRDGSMAERWVKPESLRVSPGESA